MEELRSEESSSPQVLNKASKGLAAFFSSRVRNSDAGRQAVPQQMTHLLSCTETFTEDTNANDNSIAPPLRKTYQSHYFTEERPGYGIWYLFVSVQ